VQKKQMVEKVFQVEKINEYVEKLHQHLNLSQWMKLELLALHKPKVKRQMHN
jgi:hypothetical protein